MSQNSGIISKYNFQIDIVNSNIIIFIHNVNHNSDKINSAIEIIDKLSEQLNYMNMGKDIVISKEILYEISKEHQVFNSQKEELKKYIKENQTKLLNQLEDVKFNNLNKYLSTQFTSIQNINIYKCNLCNFYTSNTLKGMAAHKRGCKKKINVSINEVDI